jgi:hypothetical protein
MGRNQTEVRERPRNAECEASSQGRRWQVEEALAGSMTAAGGLSGEAREIMMARNPDDAAPGLLSILVPAWN